MNHTFIEKLYKHSYTEVSVIEIRDVQHVVKPARVCVNNVTWFNGTGQSS